MGKNEGMRDVLHRYGLVSGAAVTDAGGWQVFPHTNRERKRQVDPHCPVHTTLLSKISV